jgi:S1-C subfamily serine protease
VSRLALLLAFIAAAASVQQVGTLHIKVTVVDADGRARPVPRHALLISDNPVSAAPERVVTSIDGTAEIRLRPGNYTVESDAPLIFQGKSYEWAQTLDVPGGRDTTLDLTTANAQIGAPSVSSAGAAPAGSASALLIDWQDSVVSIWSPTRLGSGFLIDARGLIATNQRLLGNATDAEVQFSPTKKVAARVLAADANRDVAILWVDPAASGSARPMRLGYAHDGATAVADKDKVFALEAPLDDRKTLASGAVVKVTAHAIVTNINLDDRSAGAPIMNASGEVIAISTLSDDDRAIHDVAQASIRIDEARAVIADAEKKMANAAAPSATPLPIERERPFEDDALREAAKGRAGRLGAYMIAAQDFDVAIITPVMLYGSRHREDRAPERPRGQAAGNPEEMLKSMRALQEFANWEDYVFDYPPVVMVRVTPKFVEAFWTSLARGAAQTQGMDIPASKHMKAGFVGMRLYCGEAEVTPIHPFRIERRVGEREYVYEGLYVFDPDAMSPECKTVRLTLFSEKDPAKGDTRPVDPKIVRQVRDDFAPYRAAGQMPR